MSEIELLDVSFRDGNQSLWGATGLTTGQMLQIAPVMDRAGFRALDFTSSTHMGVAVRTHRENPWERIRLVHAAMPHTPLQFIGTGFRFISWETASPGFMRLVYDRLVANGMERFIVLDPMHDMRAIRRTARMIRAAGGNEVVGALTYTVSEVHNDAYYSGLAAQMARCRDIDRVYIKDPTGLLTPDRARTLIPAVRGRLGSKPLELHSHCTLGLSPLTYLTAAELGVRVLHVACGPLASGTSLPDAHRTAANLRELGHRVPIDDRAVALAAGYLQRLAAVESRPSGTPREYDAAFLRHQVAGGVMTTMLRQLTELGLADRFDAVMAEVARVRAELGYPIMVTPFPQIVCSQAVYNVIGRERYATVPDQVIRYVLGTFGRPTGPVDAQVADKILGRPRARELMAEPPPPGLAELRARFPGAGDEELLLRAVMPAAEVDAMLAAGPARRHYNPDVAGVLGLLTELGSRPGLTHIAVSKPGFRLELRRTAVRGGHAR
jgi:oxaloacetate decarboxylase (Na+ extruding) subunit alpha